MIVSRLGAILVLAMLASPAAAAEPPCGDGLPSCSAATAEDIVANGQHFVPFGIYYELSQAQEALPKAEQLAAIRAAIDDMAGQGINLLVLYWCDLSYCGEILDHAQARGVKLMIYDENVEGFAEIARRYAAHPALFGYYIADDSNSGVTSGCHGPEDEARHNGARLRATIQALDPHHVTYISPGARATIEAMEQTPKGAASPQDCADIIGSQAYPIYGYGSYTEPLGSVYQRGRTSRMLADRRGQAYLHNLQVFRHAEAGDDPEAVPTPAEVRNMAYQAIAAGAQGFVSFIYGMEGWHLPDHPELWSAVGEVARELQDMAAFLAGKRRVEPLATGTDAILATLITAEEDLTRRLLLVVNTADEAHDFDIELPVAARVAARLDGAAASAAEAGEGGLRGWAAPRGSLALLLEAAAPAQAASAPGEARPSTSR
jgi:hypothetical protein